MFADLPPRSLVMSVPAAGPAPANKYVTAVTLAAAPAGVFRLLADVEALPRWAPEFCERVDLEGGGWRALTVAGEADCTLTADEAAGTIELELTAVGGDSRVDLALRVVALPAGGALVTLAQVRAPEQPEAQFARQRQALLAALWGLAGRFAAPDVAADRGRPRLGADPWRSEWALDADD